ncbi:MAG: Fe(3+) ABC transporter substrate-binding protein [Alphaproteobacteria bacterium]|nr:Fe(3+) ABC transporter substrate-binding protein [Alphaproteobacteria bacterium]
MTLLTLLGTAVPASGLAASGEQVLNLYSARHYQTDEALYADFTKTTGIRVNRIEGNDEEIVERIRKEGANSPADVLLLVDAGRLWRTDAAGLFQPVHSKILDARVPTDLRHPEGHWFGFSTRARIIVYDKAVLAPADVTTYESLADPRLKGGVCSRSGSNIYNLSLLAAMIEAHGEARAEAWAKGVVQNFARPPKGSDTDQIKAVAAGECKVALANTYYYVRLMRSDKTADKQTVAATGVLFANQDDRGSHVNISGGGVLKGAPHPAAAVAFLEYLASDGAQGHFANGNNEYPVIEGALDNPALKSLGEFKRDMIGVAVYGRHQALAQRIYDRVGWK